MWRISRLNSWGSADLEGNVAGLLPSLQVGTISTEWYPGRVVSWGLENPRLLATRAVVGSIRMPQVQFRICRMLQGTMRRTERPFKGRFRVDRGRPAFKAFRSEGWPRKPLYEVSDRVIDKSYSRVPRNEFAGLKESVVGRTTG